MTQSFHLTMTQSFHLTMTQSFHLTVLTREVNRIKQKHLDEVNNLLNRHFRNKMLPNAPRIWFEFNAHCPTLFSYLTDLYALGCFLARTANTPELEKYYEKSQAPSTHRRTIGLFKNLAALNMDILTSYCQVHHKDVNQYFVKIKDKMENQSKFDMGERKAVPATAGVCYALSLSGTDYFLGHILVSEDKSLLEKDIKVAVMSKDSISHTPRVSAVVMCKIKHIPRYHGLSRHFTILDTRDLGLYDFTIFINRVTRSLEDVKNILVIDRKIRYVITPAP